MRKITQKLTIIFLLLIASLGYSQKVAVIGINHVGTDGFSFVVTNDLTNGEVIYFTENEYNPTTNAFGDVVEAVVAFTAGSAIPKGNVVFVNESSANTFTVSCTGGGCGTAVQVAGTGPFALATDGEALYAYSDSNNIATDGITTMHSVMFTGHTEPVIVNGGPILPAMDPSGDWPLAIIVDGFPAVQPDRVEFTPTTPARTNVSRVMLENPSNYVHAQTNAALSTLFFTNLNLVSANPTLTVTASPSSVLENSGTGMVYTFTLSVNAPSNMTVNFTVGGNAVFATDYTQTGAATFNATSGTITILSGSNTATMTLTPTVEASLEAHENIVITIGAGSGYDAGSPGAATTTIINDDSTNNDPMVALIGISHTDPDGFSFVATKDISAGTVIYFTDKSFNNTTLLFGAADSVIRWTSPGSTLLKGSVVVVTETGTNTNAFTVTGSGSTGTVTFISGDFATATTGETMYAYSDTDSDPTNGVTDVYSVLFTGTTITTGGTIPAIEDPSTVYLSALVVDGFPSTPAPARTEYNPAQRGVLVTDVIFEDISNWVFGQSPPALSTVPFANINVTDAVPPTAICQNISVTPAPGTGSVTITASQIDNGSTDNVGIASITVSPDTFTCANIGTPVTVTLTVTDTSGNAATCTATVTVLPNTLPTFTQIGPFCSGDTFSLPTTSNNGITGTWAPAINNSATTTYTFTPDLSLCGTPVTMTVVVNPVVVPTFTSVAPICSGGSLSALPTTSNNGITGTWSPALNNTATTTYTFTPDSGTCIATATLTIAVNPLPTTPIVASNSPVCEGETVNLSVTNPISYNMSPNSGVAFIDIDATGTSVGLLSDDSEHNITIPAFTFNGTTYTNARVGMNGVLVLGSTTGDVTFTNAALPTSAVTAGNVFIAPFWEDLDIQTGAKVVTETVGNKFILQYTTSSHDLFTTGSVTFQVQMDLVTGEISFVYPDVVFGSPTYDLGASATVGIQFSTSSAMQYSFNTASLVNGQSITFSPVSYAWTGPNSFSSTLQNPSIPNATVADAGTYNLVVTDITTNCSSAQGSTTVTVNPTVTPAFTQVGPICTGDALSLPAISTNGVTGVWSPAIDNTATTTYTFTPDAGQCAVTTTMTVVVNPLTSNTTTIAACDTYTWAVNGATYTTSGTYTSVIGCDTQTLNLTITPSTSNTTTVSACDTYTWAVNGTTYTSTGIYNLVTDCNTEILDLTITPSTSNTTTVAACDTYTWAANGTTYTSSGTYTSVTGCNTEILELTIDVTPTVSIAAPIPSCVGQTVTLTATVTAAQNNFISYYDVANWTLSNTNADGSVDTTGAPTSISLTGGNNASNTGGNTDYSITVQQTGTISFNWNYSTGDGANFDRPNVVVNGVPTLMTGYSISGGTSQSGTMTVNVTAGQTFAFNMFTTDNIFGAATVVISNFSASVIPTLQWTASNGGTIVGATNLSTVDVTTDGTYTLTATNGTCPPVVASENVTFTVPVGDPSEFGNNVWNVYAWNSGGTEDTGASWNTNYAGYYTIPALSFDTQNQWCNTCSPSDAAGYQGCTVAVENHSWSAKRLGFPAGVYSIDIPSHDDEAELWVNGVLVWEHVGCCDAHTAVWQGNLGAFDTVEYRATEGVGGSHGVIIFNTLPFGPASLTGTYCGATITKTSVTLVSNYVPNAQAYRFRVRNGVTGAIVAIVDRPVNSFALSNIPGITLATTYSIDVTIRVNNVWQPFYGAPCTVTTPTPEATIGAQCGTTLTSMGQWIFATFQSSVTAYRFRITNTATNAVEIYNPVSGLNKFNFNQLPASFRSFGTVYTVEVALRNTDGTYLPYGTPCNVTTPGAPLPTRAIEASNEFKAITYPNPFAENFMFDVSTASQSTIQISIYDMLGKQVENRNVEVTDINSIQFGDNYPSGVYNVIISQGESTKTLRVIKR